MKVQEINENICLYALPFKNEILEWFLKDHVTLTTRVMTAENSAFPSQE